MMWGCVGWWYSGHWFDSGALDYISRKFKEYLAAQKWLERWGSGSVGLNRLRGERQG